MKSVHSLARALRLMNEWRDTALVTCLVVVVGTRPVDIEFGATVWAVREFGRSVAWAIAPEPAIVGGPRPPDGEQVSWAAMTIVNLVPAVLACAQGRVDVILGLNICAAVGTGLIAGGPAGVLRTYERVWDWPRRRGGGGPTETERLAGAIGRFAARLRPAKPVLAPA